MMRLLGVNIPDTKRVEISLTYLYGIGPALSRRMLHDLKISPDKRAKDITSQEANQLKEYIEKHYKIEGELRQIVRQNVQRLKDIGSYRGSRHVRRLPVRGQRTKTNSRTVRGNTRKTAGSGKRKVELK
ncbi:MAG: 30S ribosomal protein S13 [Candidatus Colwellbacteria bacterium RIFCSPHIGHO2_12_FULL_44_17]|uniref:Small ribosomal subunit protein uS13 n=2 Tax=Candidatus Colwelliibacteriota TaxID=1817904 RepID=A0A1G1Z6P1_9BACT|nr:MAG: 30S ribosomal protein S13 [Candidatus Colwellbacteria bacterium RIFCSPHIGHO2_12_FULL_44_17]OGY60109.1 MAG: 30S ribosomal protein S13 [Candidatus Colwellbacteria bacterium RIFCSPLOWO2_02_FULL_44_20b]